MDNIVSKIRTFAAEHALLARGDRVVVGVSGGADSVCLLRVLAVLRVELRLELTVVHVNHGLRAEAAEDARFVETLCNRMNVPFMLREYDVTAAAQQWKCSVEEAGRQLRYRAFEETAQELGANRIAVAHNADDNAETMLLNLFRGTGLRGLAGIPVRRGMVIRPLLCLERREIEEYLRACGQEWRTDATNNEDHYTRNRIRHHILPIASSEINPESVAHMRQTAEILAQAEDYLEEETQRALEMCVKTDDDTNVANTPDQQPQKCANSAAADRMISIPVFCKFHPALQSRVLHHILTALAPGARDIGEVHVRSLLELCGREGNRTIELPFGIRAAREYDQVSVCITASDNIRGTVCRNADQPLNLTPQQPSAAVGFSGAALHFAVFDAEIFQKPLAFPKNQYTKWLDYGKIENRLVLRTRREGDYLTISDGHGGMHHKSLQDYFTTEKVPPSERDRVPVLADGAHVVWLLGYRLSEYYKVRGDTRQILEVRYDKGEEHE